VKPDWPRPETGAAFFFAHRGALACGRARSSSAAIQNAVTRLNAFPVRLSAGI
jgi:hypothetical protein